MSSFNSILGCEAEKKYCQLHLEWVCCHRGGTKSQEIKRICGIGKSVIKMLN